jgi:hypothetical protein
LACIFFVAAAGNDNLECDFFHRIGLIDAVLSWARTCKLMNIVLGSYCCFPLRKTKVRLGLYPKGLPQSCNKKSFGYQSASSQRNWQEKNRCVDCFGFHNLRVQMLHLLQLIASIYFNFL